MNRHVCLQREESPVEQVTQADVDRVVRRSQARCQPARLAAHAGDFRPPARSLDRQTCNAGRKGGRDPPAPPPCPARRPSTVASMEGVKIPMAGGLIEALNGSIVSRFNLESVLEKCSHRMASIGAT